MFSDVIAFPIDLLRNAAVWNKSIEKLMPLPAFKVYRFIIRYIFVYVAVVCETVHLKAFESFEVCTCHIEQQFTESLRGISLTFFFISDILWQFLDCSQHFEHFVQNVCHVHKNWWRSWIHKWHGFGQLSTTWSWRAQVMKCIIHSSRKKQKCLFWHLFRMLHSTLNYARSINRLWFFSITGTSVMAPIVPILQMKRILPLHFW